MSTKCFICEEQYTFDKINDHEKACLDSITANDVQYTREDREEEQTSDYKLCQLCGKVYSSNSIEIHIKNCEELRVQQKNVGKTPNCEINYSSLSEMSIGKNCCPRSPRLPRISPTYPAFEGSCSSSSSKSPTSPISSPRVSQISPKTSSLTSMVSKSPDCTPQSPGYLSPTQVSPGFRSILPKNSSTKSLEESCNATKNPKN